MEQPLKATLSRRTFLAGSAVAAAAAGLTLAGCGGGGETTDTPSTDAGTDAGAAAQGGTLTGAMAYTSTNVNPIGNSSALMLAATWHVFEGLYDLDLHTYKTYNALAAGEPTKVSDTEYEVALRDGAKFSDGTDVTTADVVNAFEKNMADATYGAFLEFIDTVSAKDDKTVSFTLKYPFDSLLKGRLSVVKVFPASLTEDDLKTKPIGSGPWVYDTINGDDGGSIEFVPNTNYNGKYAATADKMHWDILLDDTSRTTALQEATVQVMENVPDANAEQLMAAGIKNDLDAIGVNCTINETKIDWASLAESADVLPYDVMLTPGDPTCFGNDPDLLMSWWYGDNVWTQGRSCWKKAGDGKFDELQTLMQQAREATGNEQQELWNKCFDLLAEEVPLYPLFHRELATGYQETQITGFEPIATTGLVFLGASVKA